MAGRTRARAQSALTRLQRAVTAADEVRAVVDLIVALYPGRVDRRVHVWLQQRFGLEPSESASLRPLADHLGVTCERARQLQGLWVTRALAECAGYAFPNLKAVGSALPGYAAHSVGSIERSLGQRLGDVRLLGAIRLLHLIQGRKPRRWIAEARVARVAIGALTPTREDMRVFKATVKAATRLSYLNGAFQLPDLEVAMSTQALHVPSRKQASVLASVPSVWKLDARGGYFAMQGSSWVVNKTATMLQVVSRPLTFETVYAGLQREARRPRRSMLGVAATLHPSEVVLEVLRAHPRFAMRGSEVALARHEQVRRGLTQAQQWVIDELRELGGVATRKQLTSRITSRGITMHGIVAMLQYAGYLESLEHGRWRFRGGP